jgi:hypothetical protein
MPDTLTLSGPLDSVLRKYGKIWIWSILSAAAGGLSLRSLSAVGYLQVSSFSNFNMNGAHSQAAASMVFSALALAGPPLATLVSVWYLLQFLRHHILPILFPPPPPSEQPAEVYVEPDAPPDGARLLYGAFAAMVVAMALEVAITLASLIYRALT